MTEASSGDVWSRLSRDPRDPRAAPLRASDLDRDVINHELADAFADGRLDRDEYDERTDAVLHAKTLGDFPPILADLSPADAPPPPAKVSHDFRVQAEKDYKRGFRHRLSGAVGSSAITTGIWGASSFASHELIFFWPVFVIIGTGVGVVSSFFNKEDQIDARREQLEQKAEQRALGAGSESPGRDGHSGGSDYSGRGGDSDHGDGLGWGYGSSRRHESGWGDGSGHGSDSHSGPYGPGWNGPHGAWSGQSREERRARAREWRDRQRRRHDR